MCVVILTACEKTDALTTTPSETIFANYHPAEAQAKLDQLNAFHRVLTQITGDTPEKSGDEKSGGTYTVKETEQNIEALANVSFSRGLPNLSEVSVQSDSFDVEFTDGAVTHAAAVSGYFDTHAALLNHYQQVDGTKQVLSTRLEVGPTTGTSVRYYVTTEIGTANTAPATSTCNNFMDSYWVGLPNMGDTGVCDGENYGTDLNNTATSKISAALSQYVNENNLEITTDPLFAGWLEIELGEEFSEGQEIDYINLRTPNDLLDGDKDYLLYAAFSGFDNVLCLPASDMNWYLCNYQSLVYSQPSNYPNKQLVSASVTFDRPCACNVPVHNIVRSYGTPLFVSDGPGYVNPDETTHASDVPEVAFEP